MVFVYEVQADGCDFIAFGEVQLDFPHSSKDLQRIQFMLVPVEWVLLCDLAFRTTIHRHDMSDFPVVRSKLSQSPPLSPLDGDTQV